MPNITGSTEYGVKLSTSNSATGQGAITLTGGIQSNSNVAGALWDKALNIDASLSNPIYGNSTTVQQSAIASYILIKV